eukprot:764106-Hanusia_phi.AAC.4
MEGASVPSSSPSYWTAQDGEALGGSRKGIIEPVEIRAQNAFARRQQKDWVRLLWELRFTSYRGWERAGKKERGEEGREIF